MNCELNENDIKKYCKSIYLKIDYTTGCQLSCCWMITTGLTFLFGEKLNCLFVGTPYFLLVNIVIILISIIITYIFKLWIYHDKWTKIWNTIEKTFTVEVLYNEIKLIYPNNNFKIIRWSPITIADISKEYMYIYEGIVAVHIIPLRCIDDKVKQDIFDALMNIHFGLTDDKVKEVQDYLIDLGYEITDTEKVFGSSTLKAVKKFQEDNNLKVDGFVGPKTYKILKSFK